MKPVIIYFYPEGTKTPYAQWGRLTVYIYGMPATPKETPPANHFQEARFELGRMVVVLMKKAYLT